MDLRLFTIDQAPRTLPIWDLIIADLGRPPAQRIARTLGVSDSTVYRWHAEGSAPRVAALALFWMTRWGHSHIHTQATNDAVIAVQLARSLHEERNSLRGRVASLTEERNRLRSMVNRLLRLTGPGRGTSRSADPSRTDTVPADWPGLQWPPLDDAQPSFWELFGMASAQAAAEGRLPGPSPARVVLDGKVAAAGPGSPATPPPGAHSARFPDPGRSPRLAPSARPEALPSLPSSVPQWCQSDAIMASTAKPPSVGCFEWDKPRRATAPAAPAAAARHAPPPADSGGAAHRYAMGRATHSAGQEGAQATDQDATDWPRGREPLGAEAATIDLPPAGASRRASATRPERPLTGGAAPSPPAPRAPSAAAGASAFAAITTTLGPADPERS